ncbi:prephenate dehydratase [Halioxenophilus sp. WMMB6]|uniref:prephenate dehydratase n=1 Tax=Halioxenophilus sp. WMMB6 TaxID=3073815 RepID=UPI00295EC7B8|nr:prephenate dehydratase [Halioxenophilus sp. WMMB6]
MSDNETNLSEQEQLGKLRDCIDEVDQEIAELINKRARFAQEVAQIKHDHAALGQEVVYYRPEREAQVLRKVMERNQGPLSGEEMARLFREIMSACLALERPVSVAYLGPEGTFTQQAALKHFGHSANTVSMPAIDDVFREVESGSVLYGVVPVENSTEGVINHTLDNFMTSSLKICGEVELRIHHNLLVSEVTKLDSITRIYSHSQSLAQCRKWLDNYYPMAERVAVASNAEAAKRIKGEWNSAAIAGELAARQYGLTILNEKIEDQPDNSTRFLIIGAEAVPPSGEDKTSIMVAMKNKPGALHNLLQPFHENNVDLTRVETRPSKTGAWSYVFFIDFNGHIQDERVKKTLDQVDACATDVKVLGSYPKAVL